MGGMKTYSGNLGSICAASLLVIFWASHRLWSMAVLLFEQFTSRLGETLAEETTSITSISDKAIRD
jgi:hypothetical protein